MAQTINVDSKPALFMPTLYYSQGDVGRTFEIVVSSSDGFTIPSGATCQMVATKPSGLGFTVAGTVSGNKVTFTTTAVMTDEWGRFPAELRITSGNTVIGTANFYMEGERNPHPDGTTDGQQEQLIPELTLLVERAENAAQTATDDAIEAASATIDEVLNYLPTEVTNLKSDLSKVCESVTNDLIASAYRKDGYYVDYGNGEEYGYAPFCYYRINVTEDMIGKRYMLTLGVSAQVVFFSAYATGQSNRIDGVNYATKFVIPQNTKMITISLDKTTSVACTPYLFPISSPVVNSDVDLSSNEDYKAVEDYVTIDTNDLRHKAQVVEGAYVLYGSGDIGLNSDFRYYIIPCDSNMVGETFSTSVGQIQTMYIFRE